MSATRPLNGHELRIGCALRGDLDVSHQRRGGQDRAVIKDPLSLRFFELPWSDYQLATAIRPGATAAEIARRWRGEMPALCAERDDAELARHAARLCSELRRLGLSESPARAASAPAPRLTWRGWLVRCARKISAPMFLRVRLFDPDPLLDALVARARPLLTLPALWCAAIFTGVTFAAALGRADEMALHPEWFLAWEHLLALYLGILALKVIHESGHAIVCQALGGHVHEVGAQLLAFHPTFFVDVSDTWMWPERRRRIAVAAAGFGAEMLAGAALFWVWAALAPGFARDLCLHLMFIAGVSAVFFNANPLMRYDGYHILADAVREPHLRREAFAALAADVRRVIFGTRAAPRRGLFRLYGILSTAYLVWIAFTVSGFMEKALAPVGLEGAGRLLLAAWLATMIVPLLAFARDLACEAARLDWEKRARPLLIGAAALLLIAGLAFAPVRITVERACVVDVPAEGVLRASEPGIVTEMLVREGDRVQAGQKLARLANRELEKENAQAGLEADLMKVALLSAAGDNHPAEVERNLRRFNEARANAARATQRSGELIVTSPCDGVVLTRFAQRRRGQRVRSGEEILSIAPSGRRECLLPLTEKEARRVKDHAAVNLRARTMPGATLSAHITAAPMRLENGELPKSLTALAGGDIAVDAAGKIFSSEVTHLARFTIDAPHALLLPGSTGRARLDCGTLPAWRWLFEAALDAIHLSHRV